MPFDWLKSLRVGLRSVPSRGRSIASVEPLESRTLLSAVQVGPEFRVNSYTTDGQAGSPIAMDADGDFVITWTGIGQDGSGQGVYAQRYDSTGVPQGEEFRVNSYTTGNQWRPAIAMSDAGDFVITWEGDNQDGSGTGIFAQRYNAAGVPQGSEFQVNTYATGHQWLPHIAMDATGDFLIVWNSAIDGSGWGVAAQRFNALGVPQGGEFQANTYTTGAQWAANVAMNAGGDFVIDWQSNGQEGASTGIYAQRYNSSGVPQGTEFRVNTFTTGQHWGEGGIGMDTAGNFVIAWENSGQDGSIGIYAKRYNAAGVQLGDEFRANTYTTDEQGFPGLAMDAAGNFVITWASVDQDGSLRGIYAQRYDSSGVPQEGEFRVNTTTTNSQTYPFVAMDDDGDFVITWSSNGQDGGTGAAPYGGYGVYAQRYFVNRNPTDINLSNLEVPENSPTGTTIGTFSTIDPNLEDSFTYSLVTGVGDTGNGSFAIVGNELRTNVLLDFETQESYSIRVRTTDLGGFTFEKVFTISLTNMNDPPTDISLSSKSIPENRPSGSPVGIFSTLDPDVADTFIYNLVTGTGATDNGFFTIVGNELRTTAVLDFETQSIFSIRVRSTDFQGSSTEKVFSINATDVMENGSTPEGSEFRVNTYTTDGQGAPSIALDAVGNFVITWTSIGQDGSGWGIYAQRYSASGVPLGQEFQVNTYTTDHQWRSAIAMNDAGDFVITWEGDSQDGDGSGIYAQRYNALGVPQGGEFQVNTYTTGHQWLPVIAMDSDGDFVISWNSWQDGDSWGIFAQRFNSSGVPQGAEFQVNSYTTDTQWRTSVAMDDAGNFVISWESRGQEGNPTGIYAQSFNSSGVPQGPEFRVNTSTTGLHWGGGGIAMDSDGDFVIIWENYGLDGSKNGVHAKRYNSSGVQQGNEFQVNTYATNEQGGPWIAMDAAGNFVITWGSNEQDGSGSGIFAQRYHSSGVSWGEEFQVNTFTSNHQIWSQVGMDADGDFVIAWSSDGQDGGTGAAPYGGYGIYAQRYAGPNQAPVLNNAGAPTLDPLLQNQLLTSNNGTLVTEIITRMGPSGSITDADAAALQGIAINGVANTYGSWQYTVNGGTNWTPITVTGNSNALLLASNPDTRVRFVPNTNYIGSSLFAFVAWDRTSGVNGGTANVNSRGGTTAFSTAYELVTINVSNAAPVLNNAGAPTLNSIPMNVYGVDNVGTLVSDIISRMGPSGGITDPNQGALQGIAINGLGNTATGDWQYTTNGGASWSLIGTTGNANARLLAADPNTRIRYVPQIGYQGNAIFSFVAWDRTSGGNGAVASAGTRGGTTPYSLDYEYASISVVNSAPVLNDTGNPLLDGILPNVPDASNPGTLVSDLIYRMYPAGGITDPNPYALRGIAIIGKNGTGTWEFSTNNGSSWSTINSTAASNALLLASDTNTRVRFRPAANFVGEAKIAFVAWDQSTGTNGSVVNASTRGGITAFSTAFEYASIFVNTAPTLNNAGTPTLDSISNTLPVGSNLGILITDLLNRMGPAGGITDPDPAALKGLALIGQNGTSTGTWQYTTNGGTSWSNVTTSGSANALLLASDSTTRIRYVPNAGFTGTVLIAFAAWDRSQWLNGSTINAGARGGSTPFSTDYEIASITITA